jgi:hypothetical protein
MRFREFVKLKEQEIMGLSTPISLQIPTPVFGALPAVVSGSQSADMPLRSGGWDGSNLNNLQADLALPMTVKTGKITHINDKVNPILMYISDPKKGGSIMHIPYDDFKRISGEPRVGKSIVIVFQRRTDDRSNSYSKVQSIRCF